MRVDVNKTQQWWGLWAFAARWNTRRYDLRNFSELAMNANLRQMR